MPNPVTIAKVCTVFILTDGSLRVYETPLNPSDLCAVRPIVCASPEGAIDYLRDSDALGVNRVWFE